MMWLLLCAISATTSCGFRQVLLSHNRRSWVDSSPIVDVSQSNGDMRADSRVVHKRNDRLARSLDFSLYESPSDATDHFVERELRFAGVAR
jgi:hypothetical protein